MDEAQREHFKTKGWLIVDDVLPARTLAGLNEIYSERLADPLTGWDGESLAHGWSVGGASLPTEERFAGRVLWGAPFYELVNPPRIVPILRELLGEPEFAHVLPGTPPNRRGWFFLDHDNTHFTPGFDPRFPERHPDAPLEQEAGYGASQIWTPDGLMRGSARERSACLAPLTCPLTLRRCPQEAFRGYTAGIRTASAA